MPKSDPDVTVTQAVENVLANDVGPIIAAGEKGEISQAAFDAAQDYRGAVQDMLVADRGLEADLAELEARRDLIPADGYKRLTAKALADAKAKLSTAQTAADLSYKALEQALTDEALPKFEPAREQLARDEAALALSTGGQNAENAALTFASQGNPEAVAALLSPWGTTLLRARGVRNPERVQREVRRIAAQTATARSDSTAARLLREHYYGAGAAKGAAGSTVRRITRR
jgi:hypothetical protein